MARGAKVVRARQKRSGPSKTKNRGGEVRRKKSSKAKIRIAHFERFGTAAAERLIVVAGGMQACAWGKGREWLADAAVEQHLRRPVVGTPGAVRVDMLNATPIDNSTNGYAHVANDIVLEVSAIQGLGVHHFDGTHLPHLPDIYAHSVVECGLVILPLNASRGRQFVERECTVCLREGHIFAVLACGPDNLRQVAGRDYRHLQTPDGMRNFICCSDIR